MKSVDLWSMFGLSGGTDAQLEGICDSSNPRPGHLAFIKVDSPSARSIVESSPSTVFLVPTAETSWPENCIAVERPRLAFAVASNEIVPSNIVTGIASTAIIHADVSIDPTASVGHFTQIDEAVEIGPRTIIGSHVRVHSGVKIGSDCILSNHTSVGNSGFGFEVANDSKPIRIAHVGGVEIGDRVEIGSHVAICQGTVNPTTIGSDVKIDDAVFIAHNAHIGRGAFIIAGAVLCGSAQVGENAWIAPQSVIMNKVTVHAHATVGLGAVVIRDVPPNVRVAGNPARSIP